MPNDTQSAEAKALQLRIENKKRATFDYLAMLLNYNSDELAKMGYRHGWASAAQHIVTDAKAEIERWIRAFERKYPV